ncbi:MAG TPA: SRPBCC family protein [Pirellulaceae bacterium]|nr:SRPBCC family protein [Pirellulaceae bacterium]
MVAEASRHRRRNPHEPADSSARIPSESSEWQGATGRHPGGSLDWNFAAGLPFPFAVPGVRIDMKRLPLIAALLLGLILLSVAIWYGIGASTFRFEKKVELGLTREQAFRLLTDFRFLKRWAGGRENLQRTPKNTFAVGAVTSYALVDGTERYEFAEEVLEVDVPERFVLKITNPLFVSTQTYEFEEVGSDTTRLTVKVEGHLLGRARWGGTYARGAIEERLGAELETLRFSVSQTPDLRRLLDEAAARR